nr:RHS repeat-associated core domain-containing protein [Adonisia turfae]
MHGPNVDQILAEETANGDVRWALTDHQGSVRDVIDNQGTVLNHITYNSFGQVTSETNPDIDFRFGYTGRELDEATGLMYYRARYYDPAVGTFVSEDPLGFDAGDANLYRYVFNSPTNFTDPSGLFVPPPKPAAPSYRPISPAKPVTTPTGYPIYNPTAPLGSPSNPFVFPPLDLPSTPQTAEEFINRTRRQLGISAPSFGEQLLSAYPFRRNENQLSVDPEANMCLAYFGSNYDDDDDDTVTVYRVESEANQRVEIGPDGRVAIIGNDNATLFLNFGQLQRALELRNRRLVQFPNNPTEIKAFEVPEDYLNDIRSRAVPERLAKKNRRNRSKPIVVDRGAPDQYGLRTPQEINKLRRQIIQGTGGIIE